MAHYPGYGWELDVAAFLEHHTQMELEMVGRGSAAPLRLSQLPAPHRLYHFQ